MLKKIKEKISDMKSKNAFEKFCKDSRKQKLEDFNLIIQAALKNTQSKNQTKFILSCEKFLNDREFLSEKQMEALLNISAQKKWVSRSYSRFDYDDQEMDMYESGAAWEASLDFEDQMYLASIPNR